MHPSPRGHELPADLPENKGRGSQSATPGPGRGDAPGVRGPWAKGTWGGIMSVHTECAHVPRPGSEGQSVHKDLVGDGWRAPSPQLEGRKSLQAWVHRVRSSGSLPSRRDRQLAGWAAASAETCSFRQLAMRFCRSSTRRGSCSRAGLRRGQGVGLDALSGAGRPSPLQSWLPPGLWSCCS